MKIKRRQGTRDFRPDPPIRHIVDEGNYFSVVADLPGVKEEKIRINLENDLLTLEWLDPKMKSWKREIPLPCRVSLGNKKFQNGTLELSLEKINE